MSGRQRNGVAPAHYSQHYQRDAKRVVHWADIHPETRCWRCGRTKAEHKRKWTAGHLVEGQVNGALAPECDECRAKSGAIYGNRLRADTLNPRSETF